MAIIVNKKTNLTITLHVNHTFGRDCKTNITCLQSPGASRNHASIAWNGDTWLLKDTSSNGTFVEGVRVSSGCYVPINAHVNIQFGHLSIDTWELLDLSAPVTCLIPLYADLPSIPLHDVEILTVDGDDIMIYLAEGGQWVCESDAEITPLKTGYRVGLNGQYWMFMDAHPCGPTATSDMLPALDNIEFCFNVSRDEEHVLLHIRANNERIDFGERSHHYLLLHLARQRLTDHRLGYSEPERGWIATDQLAKDLGLSMQHANTQVYRFRKLVAEKLPENCTLQQVIERRPGQLRFAYNNIQIAGGIQPCQKNSRS
ncbi:FHA domain-containing protein [Teredinibacter purpureus]|uniref:FHA domain-containing protein n=1 Tax=Teredinibacter purpureus TaxID=2731756 RepID=UPI0005F77FCD|nr:FHA domain-containing protein [Teredinibacter purpureus]